MKTCAAENCSRTKIYSGGLCAGHAYRKKRGLPLEGLRPQIPQEPTCSHLKCIRKSRSRSLCGTHYIAAWRAMGAHRKGDRSRSATLLAWKDAIPDLVDAGFSGPITKKSG